MARIAGVNIPTGKRVEIALTYIHGIGRTNAKKICEQVDIPRERRVFDLTEAELARIRDTIDKDYQLVFFKNKVGDCFDFLDFDIFSVPETQ